jgi:predicted transcriptional regulator
MDIDLLGYVRRELKAIGRAQWAALSARTGVPESTIEKIAYGFVDDPKVSNVQKLANGLMNGAATPQQHSSGPRGRQMA